MFIAVFLSWIIIGAKVSPLLESLTGSKHSGLMALAIYLPIFFISGYRLINFKCPRCKKQYSSVNWLLGSNKCMNCGLEKWHDDT